MWITACLHSRNRQIRGAFRQFSLRHAARSCASFVRSERLFRTAIHSAAHSCGQPGYDGVTRPGRRASRRRPRGRARARRGAAPRRPRRTRPGRPRPRASRRRRPRRLARGGERLAQLLGPRIRPHRLLGRGGGRSGRRPAAQQPPGDGGRRSSPAGDDRGPGSHGDRCYTRPASCLAIASAFPGGAGRQGH
jgi:hypothetical protein